MNQQIRNPMVTIEARPENELDNEMYKFIECKYYQELTNSDQICNDCDTKKLCFMCNDNYHVFDGKCEWCLSLCYICHGDEAVSLYVGRCYECIKSGIQDRVAKKIYDIKIKNYKNELETRNPVVTIDARSENELEIRNPVVTIDARSENELDYEECQVCYWDEAVSNGICLKCIKERNKDNQILRKKKCNNKLF